MIMFASCSTQFIRRLLDIEYCPLLFTPNPIILDHPAVNTCIFTFELQHWLWRNGFENEMIVAVWAIFIGFFEFCRIFAESFLALFAGEYLRNWLEMAI